MEMEIVLQVWIGSLCSHAFDNLFGFWRGVDRWFHDISKPFRTTAVYDNLDEIVVS